MHIHALSGLDDGARDVATSLAILNAEVEQGVEKVVFTPHYYGKRRSPAQFIAQRNRAYEGLREVIPAGLDAYLGAEVYFTGVNMPAYEELATLAIEGTKYILIEFPFTGAWPNGLLDRLADFMYETGYTPIIAHVERYDAVWKTPAIVTRLVKMGCLIQVNAEAFLDKREKKLAFALMKHGLVHCIGTDAHDVEGRAPNYTEAKAAVEKAGFSVAWEEAQKCMEKVLRGGQVRVECRKPVKKFFGKYL